jgi:Tfp pilus assembly protein PilX
MRRPVHHRRRSAQRRGAAVIAVVVVLVLLSVALVGAVGVGAREQDLTVRRMDSLRAFYAAEAGMNMAIRELASGVDEDGDGVIGGVSDDGDDNTGPLIGPARVNVARTEPGGVLTLTSDGRAGMSRRRFVVTLGS